MSQFSTKYESSIEVFVMSFLVPDFDTYFRLIFQVGKYSVS